MRRWLFLFVAVLVLTSCAPAKTKTNEDLRSDLRSALSLASETELFIGQIERGRLLRQFRTAQADYLRDEALRQAKEARDSETDGDTKRFALCAGQLEALSRELKSIRVQTDGGTLAETRQRVEDVKNALTAAGAGL